MFCGSAVFWWLIWLGDHIILPQQKEKGAKMNRSWPLNLPVVEKRARYKVPRSTHLFLDFPFSAESNECVLKEQYPTAKSVGKVGFWYDTDNAADDLMWCTNHMACCLLDGCLGLCIWKTGRPLIMFVIARRLTSVTFSLSSFRSLFLPPPHSRSRAPSCTLCFRCRTVPTSKASLPLIFVITQTVHSSTPPSPPAWENEKDEMAGNGEGEDGGDDLFVFGGLMRSERCCFGSRNLSCNMHPIDPLKRLPIQQKPRDDSSPSANWAMGVWCDGREFENSQISPAAIILLVLSIFIHFPLIFVNVSHAISPTILIIITIYTSVTQTH